MKADGLTLLDDTKVVRGETQFIGVSFPEFPIEAMQWELVEANGTSIGHYIYSLGKWHETANPNVSYNDISFSTEGYIPSNDVITRYAVGKPSIIPHGIQGSVAVLLEASAGDSKITIRVDRDGVVSDITDIVFRSAQRTAEIIPIITEDFVLITGDVILVATGSFDENARHLCLTLSTILA